MTISASQTRQEKNHAPSLFFKHLHNLSPTGSIYNQIIKVKKN